MLSVVMKAQESHLNDLFPKHLCLVFRPCLPNFPAFDSVIYHVKGSLQTFTHIFEGFLSTTANLKNGSKNNNSITHFHELLQLYRAQNHYGAVKLSNSASNHHLKLVAFGSAFTAEVDPASFFNAPTRAHNGLLRAFDDGSSVLAKDPNVSGFA
jgi:hypothetical protein